MWWSKLAIHFNCCGSIACCCCCCLLLLFMTAPEQIIKVWPILTLQDEIPLQTYTAYWKDIADVGRRFPVQFLGQSLSNRWSKWHPTKSWNFPKQSESINNDDDIIDCTIPIAKSSVENSININRKKIERQKYKPSSDFWIWNVRSSHKLWMEHFFALQISWSHLKMMLETFA